MDEFGYKITIAGAWTLAQETLSVIRSHAESKLGPSIVYELRASIPYSDGGPLGGYRDIGWITDDAMQELEPIVLDTPAFNPARGFYLIGRYRTAPKEAK
jgi:hypothetical protein